ncbi:GyrI-like domain-containing protein [Rossellomorea aquimaris]|uniref:GyrI-like domain-containing protein n=1 Tax=Rossellomorea aquimaris TaxID=189382 RepID=UPI001CD43B32|nr:GyrI-like domain-containing protein [Rossellomorea aquimaris]MCA1053759.1 GyrI-like domain-containing protein [Rossellomorea aquimaris]
MVSLDYEIVTLPSYRAIGMKWEGSYSEVSVLKEMIQCMCERSRGLEYKLQPQTQLGLSYHLRQDGFVHYSVFEVSGEEIVPEDMVEINIPSMSYLKVHHPKGEDIGATYSKIYQWMKENEMYTTDVEEGITYFDDLPIKHERYPLDRDLKAPHFDILIPIKST